MLAISEVSVSEEPAAGRRHGPAGGALREGQRGGPAHLPLPHPGLVSLAGDEGEGGGPGTLC